jgi:hypothetical protein
MGGGSQWLNRVNFNKDQVLSVNGSPSTGRGPVESRIGTRGFAEIPNSVYWMMKFKEGLLQSGLDTELIP